MKAMKALQITSGARDVEKDIPADADSTRDSRARLPAINDEAEADFQEEGGGGRAAGPGAASNAMRRQAGRPPIRRLLAAQRLAPASQALDAPPPGLLTARQHNCCVGPSPAPARRCGGVSRPQAAGPRASCAHAAPPVASRRPPHGAQAPSPSCPPMTARTLMFSRSATYSWRASRQAAHRCAASRSPIAACCCCRC